MQYYLRWNASHGQGSLEFRRSLVTRPSRGIAKGLSRKRHPRFSPPLPRPRTLVAFQHPEASDLSISKRAGFIPLECRASLITSVEQKPTPLLSSAGPFPEGRLKIHVYLARHLRLPVLRLEPGHANSLLYRSKNFYCSDGMSFLINGNARNLGNVFVPFVGAALCRLSWTYTIEAKYDGQLSPCYSSACNRNFGEECVKHYR